MKRIALLGLLLLLLAGCVDYSEELWLHKDGSGRVKMVVGVLTNYTNEQEINRYMDQPGIIPISKSIYRKDDFTFYSLEFKFKSLEAFNNLNDQITNANFLGKINLSKQKDGTILMSRRIELGSSPLEEDEIENLIFTKAAKGLKWRYKLHLPWKIVKANADPTNVNADTGIVSWEYETRHLWNKHQVMSVEMKQGFPILTAVLIALAALVVIVSLIFIAKSRKHTRKGHRIAEQDSEAKE